MGFNSGFKGLKLLRKSKACFSLESISLQSNRDWQGSINIAMLFASVGVRSWLRHYATRLKVAGSIPDGVSGIFHWHNPSGRTRALGSTQPLTEMSTRNFSWGVKVAGA